MQHPRLNDLSRTPERPAGRFPLPAIALLTAALIGIGPVLAQQEQPAAPAGGAAVDGAEVFRTTCASCHGGNGEGGAGPGFVGNPTLEDAAAVTSQIINGGDAMPPFGDRLNDAQVAAVATYIRTSWGNNYGEVTEEQAAQARSGGAAPAAPAEGGAAAPAAPAQ